jgi:long-chain fatty acid transport protein
MKRRLTARVILTTRVMLTAAAALAVCAPGSARASSLLDTMGPVGGNGGVQGVVSGPSAASTYFNPALLMDAEPEVLVSFAVLSEQIGVTLDGRRGGDVPLSVGGRDILGPGLTPIPNDVVPTPWLQNGCPAGTDAASCPAPGFSARPRQAQGTSGQTRTYLALGLVSPLVRDRLTVGLYGMIPLGSFTTARSFYPDEREALFSNSLHPELYGDRLTAVSIAAGAAFKLLPELSVGVGLSLALSNAASSATYVRDSSDYDKLLLNTDVTTHADVSPLIGARYKPVHWLRIGGALQSPESFKIDTAISAALPSGTESGTSRQDVYDWVPWRIAFGGEADVLQRGDYTMSVTASIKYALWSSYLDRHGQSPADYGSRFVWKDTMSGALGVRHVWGPVRAHMDMSYAPSPVPDQVGRSSYVDNDRVGLAVGTDVALKLGDKQIRPGLQVFGSRLIRRHVSKDDALMKDELPDGAVFGSTHDPVPGAAGLQTNSPGWPGFASEGWLVGGALTLDVPL